MSIQNLSHAIAAMRALVQARHSGSAEDLYIAERVVKSQAPFVFKIRRALVGNDEGMTLDKVTPGWVNKQLDKQNEQGECHG